MFYNESKLRLCLILCSVVSGWLFGIVYFKYQLTVSELSQYSRPYTAANGIRFDATRLNSDQLYSEWLKKLHLTSKAITPEEKSFGPNRANLSTESKFVKSHVKVHCLVLTRSREHSRTVGETWAKECNSVTYYGKFTDSQNALLTRIFVGDENIYSSRAFCKIFTDLLSKKHQFDWLLITMDGTFAIVDNLRYHIATLNSSNAYYLGRPVKFSLQNLYNAYDSGIVLSQGSVKKLITRTFATESRCLMRFNQSNLMPNSAFDSFLGYELQKVSVLPMLTLDQDGSSLFHPFSPDKHMNPSHIRTYDTYWTSNVFPVFKGFESCGRRAVTFGSLTPVNVRFMYYLLYHVAVFKQQYRGLGNTVLVKKAMAKEMNSGQREHKVPSEQF